MAEISTCEAARRLEIDPRRVRVLLQNGQLQGRRIGSVWVVDEVSVELRKTRGASIAGRPFSQRTAWSAGALGDGIPTPWLTSSERRRLRTRLRKVRRADTNVFLKWMTARATHARYRVAKPDLAELVTLPDVIRGGVSAAGTYDLGITHGAEAEIYTDPAAAERLRREFFLIDAPNGNLLVRCVTGSAPWHVLASQPDDGRRVAPRLIVAADLLDHTDARSRSAGARLLAETLGGEFLGA